MERAAWTNERLDDLAESIRSGFARNDAEHLAMRSEMQNGFTDLRTEMHQGFAELRASIQRTHLTLIVGLTTVIVGLIGVVATVLARGA